MLAISVRPHSGCKNIQSCSPSNSSAATNGAILQKPAHDAFRAGCSGYFCDPDGHPWEVAYNPFMPLGPDGAVALGD
jgi:hypothetical protein